MKLSSITSFTKVDDSIEEIPFFYITGVFGVRIVGMI